MKHPGTLAVLAGVAVVTYLLLPQIWVRFFYAESERIFMTIGIVSIVWGLIYLAQRGRDPRSN
jgi:hypothetical protein